MKRITSSDEIYELGNTTLFDQTFGKTINDIRMIKRYFSFPSNFKSHNSWLKKFRNIKIGDKKLVSKIKKNNYENK